MSMQPTVKGSQPWIFTYLDRLFPDSFTDFSLFIKNSLQSSENIISLCKNKHLFWKEFAFESSYSSCKAITKSFMEGGNPISSIFGYYHNYGYYTTIFAGSPSQ